MEAKMEQPEKKNEQTDVKVEPTHAGVSPAGQKVKVAKFSREVAIVNGFSLPISTKNSTAIGHMIMRKPIDRAIEMLELVLQKKMAVPMTSLEIPHRKRSLMPGHVGGGGRFPANAAKEVIHLLKQLKANCESGAVENPVVTLFVANIASRPFRKDRTRAKRTHIHLEARDKLRLASLSQSLTARDKTKLIVKKK